MPAKKKLSTAEPAEIPAAPVTLPSNAHSYYVYPEGSDQCVAIFDNEAYRGEALKFAEEFAKTVNGTVRCE